MSTENINYKSFSNEMESAQHNAYYHTTDEYQASWKQRIQNNEYITKTNKSDEYITDLSNSTIESDIVIKDNHVPNL